MIVLDNFSVFRGKTTLLRPFSLTSAEANCLLVSGETGCGKSSCLRSLLGIGQYWYKGSFTISRTSTASEVLRLSDSGLAYLPQELMDVGDLSIAEFLAISSKTVLQFSSARSIRRRMSNWVDHALAAFPGHLLHPLGDLTRPLRALNFAHARYAALLRLRLNSAKLALLDEPLEGLSSNLTQLALGLFNDSLEKGLVAVLVDHRQLVNRCSRAVVEVPRFEWTYGE